MVLWFMVFFHLVIRACRLGPVVFRGDGLSLGCIRVGGPCQAPNTASAHITPAARDHLHGEICSLLPRERADMEAGEY